MTRSWRILVVVLVQTAVLAGMIGAKVWTLETGREVLLATEPVDPTDLLRGDYVDLAYEISLVNVDLLEGAPPAREGERLYVVLAPEEDGLWRARRAVRALPPRSADEVAIRGRVEQVRETAPVFDGDGQVVQEGHATRLRMSYGIESYFVPEGTGGALEALRNEGNTRLRILVAVDGRGSAAIKGLIVDGKLVAREGLF
ncbi:MAG: GDYXXLXY domain-containing protein [Alphaproteobacteria bacterium]|nr:GDYXXLXY domain-containing protein [Alphaproteobacteria bacterium]